jgi:hypothetical protein
MLKLSRKDLNKLAELGGDANELWGELDTLLAKFGDELDALLEKLREVQTEAAGIMDDAANEAKSYYEEKSETWQEGERGGRYAEWKDRLREIADAINEDIEPPEVAMPDRPDWIGDLEDPDFSECEF